MNDLDPEILESQQGLFFHLQQQRLIELIRQGQLAEALHFAQVGWLAGAASGCASRQPRKQMHDMPSLPRPLLSGQGLPLSCCPSLPGGEVAQLGSLAHDKAPRSPRRGLLACLCCPRPGYDPCSPPPVKTTGD